MASNLESLEFVEPASRKEWRAWLAEHAETSPGIWLAVGKKGNRRTTLFLNDAVEEAVAFGWIDSTVHRLDEDRFRQLYTPRRPGGNWSSSNKERVARLTEAGLMTPRGLAVVAAAQADGSWDLLTDVEALVIPNDLAELLARDECAAAGWDALPTSSRQQLLHWLSTARRPETRERRLAATIESALSGRMPRV